MIYIASDHAGFKLKNIILNKLKEITKITDMGPYELIPTDDYPDYVKPLVEKVLSDTNSLGILICRNGVGVCMAANKYKGVRAGLSWNYKHAVSSKNDDNTNILCLPADYIQDEDAIKTVVAWIETPFGNKEKYIRRIEKANL